MPVVTSKYYKAMLDTIAYTEGPLGVSQNGYDVLFAFHTINGWSENCTFGHGGNDWLIKDGYATTAAGRYGFLGFVWWELSEKNKTDLDLTKLTTPNKYKNRDYYYNAPFSKSNQDYLAYKLISGKVSESELIEASKSADNFSKMIVKGKIDCTWTSLARSLPKGTDVITRCGYKQDEPGKVVNPSLCASGCKSGAEENWEMFKLALSKY